MSVQGHGTYGMYQRERGNGQEPCLLCKEAARQYQAKYRANPEKAKEERRRHYARQRARARLAKLHWQEYEALCREEYERSEGA